MLALRCRLATGLTVAFALALLGLPAAGSAAPIPTCFGKPATIVRLGAGAAHVHGGPHADVIVTGAGADTIEAGGGDDRICTRGGDDRIHGGPGHDRVDAGAGNDVVEGENGTDEVRGGPGVDRLVGGAGHDSVSFARSQKPVEATLGGEAVNAVISEPSDDCSLRANFQTTIETTVESIEGSAYDDVLHGDGADNTILGRGGDDQILGRGGDDLLVGGSGRDELAGQAGFDRLYLADAGPDAPARCGTPPAPGGIALLDPADPAPRGCRIDP